jgi:lysine biosynthesis protein LysW
MRLPSDAEIGEIISCHCCGLELEVKDKRLGSPRLEPLTLEGEDWGE